MAAKFLIKETILASTPKTVRLGAGTGSANNVDDKERGKAVKLVGDSRYDLCAAGDPLEAFITSVEVATADGYTIGGVADEGYKEVTFDGLQATAGTGVIAIGDYVLAGTAVAKGTALTTAQKVVKATDQAAAKAAPFAWRVVSLGSAGTGAVGTVGVIEPVRC